MGMCIRNEKGKFVNAKTIWREATIPPQEAQALGLSEALLWLSELGVQRVTIELDCKSVMDGVIGNLTNLVNLTLLLKSVKLC